MKRSEALQLAATMLSGIGVNHDADDSESYRLLAATLFSLALAIEAEHQWRIEAEGKVDVIFSKG